MQTQLKLSLRHLKMYWKSEYGRLFFTPWTLVWVVLTAQRRTIFVKDSCILKWRPTKTFTVGLQNDDKYSLSALACTVFGIRPFRMSTAVVLVVTPCSLVEVTIYLRAVTTQKTTIDTFTQPWEPQYFSQYQDHEQQVKLLYTLSRTNRTRREGHKFELTHRQ
jgi:hypothetical protein